MSRSASAKASLSSLSSSLKLKLRSKSRGASSHSAGSVIVAWVQFVIVAAAVALVLIVAACVVGIPLYTVTFDHRTVSVPPPAELRPWWVGEVYEWLLGTQYGPHRRHEVVNDFGDVHESWLGPEPNLVLLIVLRTALDMLILFPLSLIPAAWASARLVRVVAAATEGGDSRLASFVSRIGGWVLVFLWRAPFCLVAGADAAAWLWSEATRALLASVLLTALQQQRHADATTRLPGTTRRRRASSFSSPLPTVAVAPGGGTGEERGGEVEAAAAARAGVAGAGVAGAAAAAERATALLEDDGDSSWWSPRRWSSSWWFTLAIFCGLDGGAKMFWLCVDRKHAESLAAGALLAAALFAVYGRVRAWLRSPGVAAWKRRTVLTILVLFVVYHAYFTYLPGLMRWWRTIRGNEMEFWDPWYGIPKKPPILQEVIDLSSYSLIPLFAKYSKVEDRVEFRHCPYSRLVQVGHYEPELGGWHMRIASSDADLVRVFCMVPFLGWKNLGFARFEPRPYPPLTPVRTESGAENGGGADSTGLGAASLVVDMAAMEPLDCNTSTERMEHYLEQDFSGTLMNADMHWMMMGCPLRKNEVERFVRSEMKGWCGLGSEIDTSLSPRERQVQGTKQLLAKLPQTEKKRSAPPPSASPATVRGPNVLVLQMDSLAPSHMFLAMKKVVHLFAHVKKTGSPSSFRKGAERNAAPRTHEVYHFPFYVTVERKSHNNQLPLTTGFPWARFRGLGNVSHPGWIWQDFRRQGYRTAWVDEVCNHVVQRSFYGWGVGEDLSSVDHFSTGIECHPFHSNFKQKKPWRNLGRYHHEILYEFADSFLDVSGRRGTYPPAERRFIYVGNQEAHEPTGNTVRLAANTTADFLQRVLARDPNLLVLFIADHGPHYGNLPQEIRGANVHDLPPFFMVAPTSWLDSGPNLGLRTILRENQNRSVTAFDIHATMRHLASWPQRPPDDDRRFGKGLSLLDGLIPQRTCTESGALRYCKRTWDASQEQQCPLIHPSLQWGKPYRLNSLAGWDDYRWSTAGVYSRDHF